MNVMAVTQEFLLKNPDTVERAMKAYIEAVAKMNNDKTATVKVLAKYTKRNDASFLDETLRYCHSLYREDAAGGRAKCRYGPGVRAGQRRGWSKAWMWKR
jgi:ABC-type nitrate/sulfonate/bicarbonate transport system substrate-binding protein